MAKLSEKKKVELLESAVLRNDVEEVRRLFTEHGSFEFTARALGLACRFCGLEMVKALVENGATFRYDNDTPFKTKYGVVYERKDAFYPANYGTMISLKSFKQVRWSQTVTRGIDPQCAFFDPDTYSSIKEREPISEDERVEIVHYVMDKGVRGFDRGEVLFFAILSGYGKIIQYMIERGVRTGGIYKFTPSNRLILREELLDALIHMSEEEQLAILDLFAKVLPTDGRDYQKRITINGELTRILRTKPLVKYLFDVYETPDIRDPESLLMRAMETDDAALMAELLKHNCVKSVKKRDELIDKASKGNKTQVLAVLLDYKNRTANIAKEAEARERRERSELNMSTTSVAYLKKIWNYEKLPDGTLVITGYKGNDVNVTVPEKIGESLVTEIGESAFSPNVRGLTQAKIASRKQIQTIALPEGIRKIGGHAFQVCEALVEIVLPKSVKTIGRCAFDRCEKLTGIAIPRMVEEIGESAFSYCKGLTEITIPGNVKTIGESAFSYCKLLADVEIMEGVKKIGRCAFRSCDGLKRAQLPKSLRETGEWMFYSCGNLTNVEIPEGIQVIGELSFYGCYGLKEIRLPNSITEIREGAFSYCSSLANVEMPKGIVRIGASAFLNCHDLTEIAIPAGVKEIGGSAFSGCRKLTSIVLPEGLEKLGDSAFASCVELAEIAIPVGVKEIGGSAFSGCGKLTGIALPEGLEKLGESVFSGCGELAEIALPKGVKEIGRGAFSGCGKLTGIALPEELERLGASVFADCSELAEIAIPKGVKEIGESAFANCGNLVSVTIAEDIRRIKGEAFVNCGKLPHIRIPSSVEIIENDAFKGCSDKLLIQCDRGSTAEKYAMRNGLKYQAEGGVPKGQAKARAQEADAKQIKKSWSYKVQENGTVKITGYKGRDEDVTVPKEIDGCAVTVIDDYAFCPERCSTAGISERRKNIKRVVISDYVEIIGEEAFSKCSNLTEVVLPNSIRKIGPGAFQWCKSLTSVKIPDGMEEIEWDAFGCCFSLTSIVIPESVSKIGDRAFLGCREDLVIMGAKDSCAEEYAKQHQLNFQPVE